MEELLPLDGEISRTAAYHYYAYTVLLWLFDFNVHDRVDQQSCRYSDRMYEFADTICHSDSHSGNFGCNIWCYTRSAVKQRDQDATTEGLLG